MLKHLRLKIIPAAWMAALGVAAPLTGAQTLTHLADPANARASPRDSASASLDQALRSRLASPDPANPSANYVAAALETTDRAARVRYLAAARIASPQEKLYLASLGLACVAPVHGQPVECEAMDRLADWARRDQGNGLPALLLADRARQRGEREAMVAYLELAAGAPRFDDYSARAGLVLWDYVFASPIAADPEVKARWVTARGVVAASTNWSDALNNTCVTASARTDAWRSACAQLGEALLSFAGTLYGRRLGDSALERNTADAAVQRQAAQRRAAVDALVARCGAARLEVEQNLDSPDPRAREAAIGDEHQWLEAWSRFGEVGTCERVRDGLPRLEPSPP